MSLLSKNQATPDILQVKAKEAVRLAKQAEDAVDLVTRTISSLDLINEELDAAMDEIDRYTSDLSATREKMANQRKNNSAIISNFSKLLSTEE